MFQRKTAKRQRSSEIDVINKSPNNNQIETESYFRENLLVVIVVVLVDYKFSLICKVSSYHEYVIFFFYKTLLTISLPSHQFD